MASSALALALVTARAAADDERVDFSAPGQAAPISSGEVVATAATPRTVRQYQGQRNLGLVATAGGQGLGLGLRGGTQRLGIEATGGWEPLLETYAEKPGDVSVKFFSTWQFNANGYLSFYRSNPQADVGVAALYQYNTVLHHGAGLAFYAQYDIGERWAVHFLAGVVVFPRAEHLLRDTGRFPPGGSITSGLSSVRPGLAISLGFFP